MLPAFVLTACAAALNAVTSGAGYDVLRNVPYGEGERAKLDLYIPTRTTPTTPVLVFIHGGSWDSGSKDIYLFVGQSLASEGFIVAIPNYRLYPQVRFPAFVEDAAKAVVKVERMMDGGVYGVPGGDHPFFLMGHSAGAEIAGLLATDGRYLKAAGGSIRSLDGFIGLAGPYDFLPLTEERYKRIFPEAAREASQPVNFVSGDEPPMLLIHGGDDASSIRRTRFPWPRRQGPPVSSCAIGSWTVSIMWARSPRLRRQFPSTTRRSAVISSPS